MGCCVGFRGERPFRAASACSGGLTGSTLEEREFEGTTEGPPPPRQTQDRASLQTREYIFQLASPFALRHVGAELAESLGEVSAAGWGRGGSV